jgi:hypothetical protein
MENIDSNNFNQQLALFKRYFDLNARLPNMVLKRNSNHKLVIGESGDFHNTLIFERLSEEYGDTELSYLMIEPEAKEYFNYTDRFLIYSIRFDAAFRRTWTSGTLDLVQAEHNIHKIVPQMIAGLQCYVGSSEKWSSYHDNHNFELDIFSVPDTCDTLRIFGKPSWSLTDFKNAALLHNLEFSEQELLTLKINYFI